MNIRAASETIRLLPVVKYTLIVKICLSCERALGNNRDIQAMARHSRHDALTP